MSFDWSNFVVLADELRTLNSKGGVEARLRSSMSRSYYGMFHLVRQWLEKEGHQFSGHAEVHQEVVQILRTSNETAKSKIGIDLGRMRQYRNAADYDDLIENVAQLEGMCATVRDSIQKKLAVLGA